MSASQRDYPSRDARFHLLYWSLSVYIEGTRLSPFDRHEGRKMKQELRCHAVLCPSENKAKMMAEKLQNRLHQVHDDD
jgi:plasmid rolling circle replication initiator protein Rep